VVKGKEIRRKIIPWESGERKRRQSRGGGGLPRIINLNQNPGTEFSGKLKGERKMKRMMLFLVAAAAVFLTQPVWACGEPGCTHTQNQFQHSWNYNQATGIGLGFGGNSTSTAYGGQGGYGIGYGGTGYGYGGSVGDISIKFNSPNIPPGLGRDFGTPGQVPITPLIQPSFENTKGWNVLPKVRLPRFITREEAVNMSPGSATVEPRIFKKMKCQTSMIQVFETEEELQTGLKSGKFEQVGHVYAKTGNTTSDILGKTFTASMDECADAISLLGRDIFQEPSSFSLGFGPTYSNSNLRGSEKDESNVSSAGLFIGYGKAKKNPMEGDNFEVFRIRKEWYKIVPPPPPKAEAAPPKEEPKKEAAPVPPPPQVIEKIIEKEVKVEIPVNPFADLPKLIPVRFELNSAKVKNFAVSGVEFKNQEILEETKTKIREKVAPLMQKYPDLRLYFIGYTSGEGPAGTFHTKTKEGAQFSNNEVYNRGGLAGARSNAVGAEVVKATGLDPNRCLLVTAGWNQNQKFDYGSTDMELVKTFQRSVHIVLGHDIATARPLTK
jgi:hypothetical protein